MEAALEERRGNTNYQTMKAGSVIIFYHHRSTHFSEELFCDNSKYFSGKIIFSSDLSRRYFSLAADDNSEKFSVFYFSYRLFSFLKVCHPRNQYCDADADALIHASALYSIFWIYACVHQVIHKYFIRSNDNEEHIFQWN